MRQERGDMRRGGYDRGRPRYRSPPRFVNKLESYHVHCPYHDDMANLIHEEFSLLSSLKLGCCNTHYQTLSFQLNHAKHLLGITSIMIIKAV